MIRTVEDARRYLLDRIDFERRPAETPDEFRLDGIRALLEAVGNPQERVPVVHVAGTKGKGSTSAMIAAALTGCGYRTGLYTSPHLVHVEERCRVDGVPIGPEDFTALAAELQRAEATIEHEPTFFEAVTALAWMHFARTPVDVAVVEVGIGGRLDSTNVCRPVTTVITNTSLDHTRLLGDSPAAIAREKAGIVKPGITCTSGVLESSAREVVRSVCREQGAPLWELTADVTVEVEPDFAGARDAIRVRTPVRSWPRLRVPLAGEHQAVNATLAVASLDAMVTAGWSIDPARAAEGIENLAWPLRFEIVSDDPLVVCDAAHNEASIAAVVATLDRIAPRDDSRKRIAVFACARDKDHTAMLRVLMPAFDEVVLTRFVGNPRAIDPVELARAAGDIGGAATRIEADPVSALTSIERTKNPADIVCATGSFFLAAEVREHLLAVPANDTTEATR